MNKTDGNKRFSEEGFNHMKTSLVYIVRLKKVPYLCDPLFAAVPWADVRIIVNWRVHVSVIGVEQVSQSFYTTILIGVNKTVVLVSYDFCNIISNILVWCSSICCLFSIMRVYFSCLIDVCSKLFTTNSYNALNFCLVKL